MSTQIHRTIHQSDAKKGVLEVHIVHKTKSHQAFTKVEMFPANWMGKETGKKPTIMKCKLDTGASGNVMPLSMYQHINPSEFDKKCQPITGYGHDRTILKGYNGNPIQQYCIRVILYKWNNQYWRYVFHIVEARRTSTASAEYIKKDVDLHSTPKHNS